MGFETLALQTSFPRLWGWLKSVSGPGSISDLRCMVGTHPTLPLRTGDTSRAHRGQEGTSGHVTNPPMTPAPGSLREVCVPLTVAKRE